MRYQFLIFLLLIFIPIFSFCQFTTIKGSIVNKNSSEIIPFVSVAVSGTYLGTVANLSGEFVLSLPNALINQTITFSSIGYETYVLKFPTCDTKHTIELTPINYQLGEITVMPDSTLRILIRKAYQKIPDNYPDKRTRSKGFLRMAMREYNGEYLMLTEAMLDVFKTSYKNKTTGQVRIDKSRKYNAPDIDTINNTSFYGGHFIPHNADIVKNRNAIVQATKKYNYRLEGITKKDNRELYVIHFEPSSIDSKGFIGKMYIDKESLAFEKFEYRSNEENLKFRENRLFSNLSSKESKNIVIYEPTAGKYYLKTASYSEIFENIKTKLMMEHFSEYILIETLPENKRPMPYSEISDYSVALGYEATPYFESDWRDYPIAQIDESKLMSQIVADSIFVCSLRANNEKTEENEKVEKLLKFLSVIQRFNLEYNVLPQVVHINDGTYSLSQISGNKLTNRTLKPSNNIQQYEVSIGYKFTNQFKIMYSLTGNLNEKYYSEIQKIGFSFIIPLKTYGKNLFLNIQPGYKFQNIMFSLGKSNNLFRYEKENLVLKEGKSELLWGSKSSGFDGRIALCYQLSRQLWLNVFTGYYFQKGTQTVLRFEDKSGNYFTRKNNNISLEKSEIEMYINELPVVNPKIELNPLYVGFGIKLTL